MIKLIATDVDDTIVKEGSRDVNPEYRETFYKLMDKGIKVCVCTGRQINSVRSTFKDYEGIGFIAGNGTFVDTPWYKKQWSFKEEDYRDLVKELHSLPKEYYVMVDAGEISYFEPGHDLFYKRMSEKYHYRCEYIDNIANITNVGKISVFREAGIEEDLDEYLTSKWGERMEAIRAGYLFFDFMGKGNNKGRGLSAIQEHFGITPEETVVFGNADNDAPMFYRAKRCYAVSNASENLKAKAMEVIGPQWEDSVLGKIKEILSELEI